MNRRTLKRLTSNLCGELFAECIVLSHIHKDKQEQIDKIMVKILNGQDSMLCRLSHVEPGNVKGFFKKYHEDLKALERHPFIVRVLHHDAQSRPGLHRMFRGLAQGAARGF